MKTSTDLLTELRFQMIVMEELREALDRLAYWSGMVHKHIPDATLADELMDAVHTARGLLDK
jgi:hypothetical protein